MRLDRAPWKRPGVVARTMPGDDGGVYARYVGTAGSAAEGDTSRLFSGHEPDGGRAASGRHEHVFIAADDSDGDGRIERIVVAAPWVCDRAMLSTPALRRVFDAVVSQLHKVRAGRLGCALKRSSTMLEEVSNPSRCR
jgi:hypothetical protein